MKVQEFWSLKQIAPAAGVGKPARFASGVKSIGCESFRAIGQIPLNGRRALELQM